MNTQDNEPDAVDPAIEAEQLCQKLNECQKEIKKCIDNVLEMREKAAELELELVSVRNPEVQGKLQKCKEAVKKCESLMGNLQNNEKMD